MYGERHRKDGPAIIQPDGGLNFRFFGSADSKFFCLSRAAFYAEEPFCQPGGSALYGDGHPCSHEEPKEGSRSHRCPPFVFVRRDAGGCC